MNQDELKLDDAAAMLSALTVSTTIPVGARNIIGQVRDVLIR